MNLPEHVIMVSGDLKYQLWVKGVSTWRFPEGVPKNYESYHTGPFFMDYDYYNNLGVSKTVGSTHVKVKPIIYQLTCKLKDIL